MCRCLTGRRYALFQNKTNVCFKMKQLPHRPNEKQYEGRFSRTVL